jgi:hypothetical protein
MDLICIEDFGSGGHFRRYAFSLVQLHNSILFISDGEFDDCAQQTYGLNLLFFFFLVEYAMKGNIHCIKNW